MNKLLDYIAITIITISTIMSIGWVVILLLIKPIAILVTGGMCAIFWAICRIIERY